LHNLNDGNFGSQNMSCGYFSDDSDASDDSITMAAAIRVWE